MKRKSLLILGLIAMLGLGVTACKKTCDCKAYYLDTHVSEYDMSSTTKKKDCKDYTQTVTEYDPYSGHSVSATVKMDCSWGD